MSEVMNTTPLTRDRGGQIITGVVCVCVFGEGGVCKVFVDKAPYCLSRTIILDIINSW